MQLNNLGTAPLERLNITFHLPGSMDRPTETSLPDELEGSEGLDVPLSAEFTEKILDTSPETEREAKITITHKSEGWRFRTVLSPSVDIFYSGIPDFRDPVSLAPFVSSKDPTVRRAAAYIEESIYGKAEKALDAGLVNAAGTFQFFKVLGVETLPADLSDLEPSSIAFPNKVLSERKGNGVEVAACYCAVLEALGMKTAYIPVQGSPLVAVQTEFTAEDLEKFLVHPESVILDESSVWIPVDCSSFSEGFFSSWLSAVELIGEGTDDPISIMSVRDAWEERAQTGFSRPPRDISFPEKEYIASSFLEELEHFKEWEMGPRIEEYESRIASGNGKIEVMTQLGILFAKYGKYRRAIETFDEILLYREHVPSLVNMGNIYYLQEEYRMALPFYKRAYRRAPYNPLVLLGLARCNHALENYGNTEYAYGRLENIDEGTAEMFSYLQKRGSDSEIEMEDAGLRKFVLWMEEE